MTVTRDATSGLYMPQSSAEWTELLLGTGIPNPTVLFLCQEASGNLADTMGTGQVMAVAGSPSYRQTVSGQSTKAVLCTDGSTSVFKNTAWPNASSLLFAYLNFPASTGGTERSVLTLGASYNAQVAIELKISSNPTIPALATHGDVLTNGASSSAGVHPVLLQANKTAGSAVVQTDLETITHATTGADNLGTLALGGDNVNYWESAGVGCLYLAGWTAYEPDATDRAALLDRLANGPSVPSVTKDATSGLPIPQNATEWNGLLAGMSRPAPDLLWILDQASGAAIDLIGSINGTVSGDFAGPTFHSVVAGWASLGILFHNGNNDGCDSTAAGLPDINTTAIMGFMWSTIPNVAGRGLLSFGTRAGVTGAFVAQGVSAGHTVLSLENASALTDSGTGISDGAVHGILFQVDPGSGQEILTTEHGQYECDLDGSQGGKGIYIANGNVVSGSSVAAGQVVLYFAAWFDSNAEWSLADQSELIRRMTIAVTSIVVAPSTEIVTVGGTVNLTATATYSDSTTADITATATWSTSDAGIATVAAGVVTGVSIGTVTITATNGVDGTCEVTVGTKTDVAIRGPSRTYVGRTISLVAMEEYAGGLAANRTATATWDTSNHAIATVVAGVVTGVSHGVVDVTAIVDGLTGAFAVTVDAKADAPTSLDPLSTTSGVGFWSA